MLHWLCSTYGAFCEEQCERSGWLSFFYWYWEARYFLLGEQLRGFVITRSGLLHSHLFRAPITHQRWMVWPSYRHGIREMPGRLHGSMKILLALLSFWRPLLLSPINGLIESQFTLDCRMYWVGQIMSGNNGTPINH